MKTRFQKILLPLMVLIAASSVAQAQPNTVDLKDGTSTILSSHASIAAAYAAIPAALTQAYIIELKTGYNGASETYPISFVAKTGASASNTITLRPAAGVTTMSVSGSASGQDILALNDADWVILDGRAGGTGNTRVLTFNNAATAGTSNTIALINGACNNVVRYCNINNATSVNAGRNISLGVSATNTAGNSDNLFEHNKLVCGRYGVQSAGTAANPNRRNTFRGNLVENVRFAGIWMQSNTGSTTIDSNYIYNTAATGDGPFAIIFDAQADTAIVTRNTIADINNGTATSGVRGISFRSTSASATTNYSYVVNNMIALPGNTGSTSVVGIEYAGAALINAAVHFNSVRIGGALTSGGTSGNMVSAAVSKTASSTASTFAVSNNLFVNERSGGAAGTQHIGASITATAGTITSDYNVYNVTSGNLARYATALQTTLAGLQAVSPPNEANANTSTVQFVSTTDLHLAGTSIGSASLVGIAVAGVTTDIEGDARVIPNRGADEALSPCTGTPAAAIISGPGTAPCAGAPFTLAASGQTVASGISYYWQSRPAGSTGAWTSISGATTATLTTSVTAATEFRFVDSCALSIQATPSNVLTITPAPLPIVASISETHTLLQYNFSAIGTQNVTGYSWDFGDGSPLSVLGAPSHTYSAPGSYTVTLIVTNACGSDTATLMVNAQACNGTPVSTAVFRSDSTLCPTENALLHVIFSGGDLPVSNFLTVQWQSSPNGTSGWTNVTGATDDTLIASPTDTTYYRYILTCGGTPSGSVTSNAVAIYTLQAANVAGITSTNVGSTYTFTATSPQGVATYNWNWGDGAPEVNGTSPVQVHSFASSGSYVVTLRVSGPCGADTVTLLVAVTVGIEDAQADAGIAMYPNPALSSFSIRSAVPVQRLEVLDMKGARVLQQACDGRAEVTVNVRGLAAGAYIVRVQTARGVVHLPLRKL